MTKLKRSNQSVPKEKSQKPPAKTIKKINAKKPTNNKPPKKQPKPIIRMNKLLDKIDELQNKNKNKNNNVLQLVKNDIESTKDKINAKTKAKNPENDKSKVKNDEFNEEMEKELAWRESEVTRLFKEGRNRGGRPTKLTEIVIRDAEVLARLGLSERSIAESLMIDQGTLINWMKKSKVFFNRLKKAREKGKNVLVNSIYGHGRKSWQATAFLLERMYREEFGANQKVELAGAGGGPVTFVVRYESKKASEPVIKTKKDD